MNLKKIIKKSLMVGGLITLLATPTASQDRHLKVALDPNKLMLIVPYEFEGMPFLSLSYDSDGDGTEDSRFIYSVKPTENGLYTELLEYYVDLNKDHQFEENERFVPKEDETQM